MNKAGARHCLQYAAGCCWLLPTMPLMLNCFPSHAARVPYMVAIGNHEYDYERGHGLNGPDISGADDPYSPDWCGWPCRAISLIHTWRLPSSAALPHSDACAAHLVPR